jgi:enoyl-[acyl-carrier protein] reductase / trans-2-enoyl-CoA reductase (NAD+)
MNAHPAGCAAGVKRQIEFIKAREPIAGGPKNALVIGCSTGYGLASRIAAAFGSGAGTLGISFERVETETKCGTPGYYNNRAFDEFAKSEGLVSQTILGDAYSDEVRELAISRIKELFGKVDLVIYSLASPVRTEPSTGITWQSCIKPLEKTYSGTLVDMMSGKITNVTIPPATDVETQGCVKVMGGEDWELWMRALKAAGVLAEGVKTLAYSYIGPGLSSPIYRGGTLGKAKEHLEATAKSLTAELQDLKGSAWVSINKALVTRASAVIPAIPLYIMALYRVMKEMGIHEGCIDQIYRLYRERVYASGPTLTDEQGRIRIDDWELRQDVQEKVDRIMAIADENNLSSVADLEGYRADFLEAHGFGIPGIDYGSHTSHTSEVRHGRQANTKPLERVHGIGDSRVRA